MLQHNSEAAREHYAELAPIVVPDCEAEGSQARVALLIDRLDLLVRESGIATRLRDYEIDISEAPTLAREAMKQTRLLVNNRCEISKRTRSVSTRPPGEPKAAGLPDRIQDLASDDHSLGRQRRLRARQQYGLLRMVRQRRNAWMVEQGMLDIAQAIRSPSWSRPARPTPHHSNFPSPWKSD